MTESTKDNRFAIEKRMEHKWKRKEIRPQTHEITACGREQTLQLKDHTEQLRKRGLT